MHKTKKAMAGFTAALMMAAAVGTSAYAAEDVSLAQGTYTVDSSLSCYVNAMGGIEFGASLLTGTKVTVDESGNASMTLGFTKSQVTIYSVTCDTFIDATNSQPAFYDADGNLNKADATYTLSSDTALNPGSEAVNYVDSLTFPVESYTDTYTLYLYVNSNVMGVQFCDGSGTAGSNNPDTLTKYVATLTVDWSTAAASEDDTVVEPTPDDTTSQSADVVYSVQGVREVSIPETITVDSATKTGEYTVTAEDFLIDEGAYVTVTATESGKLSNGSAELNFTNVLESGKLTKTGDTLSGTVTVTDTPTVPGTYQGTVDFNINYFAK